MKLIITKNHEEMSQEAAKIFIEQIKSKPNSVLGLATGGTPEVMYQLLIEANEKKEIDFKDITTFNLDEYVGIEETHPMSYRTFMNQNLFSKVNIDVKNTNVPNGFTNVEQSAKEYDALIHKAGGIDLQVLGIGTNAHIAFNEPPAKGDGKTNIVELTESTIDSNSRYFDSPDDVPTTAITMGIGSILEAKKIILLASGKSKAQAIYDTFNSLPNETVPASFLQNHDNVVIIVDEEAASLIKKPE